LSREVDKQEAAVDQLQKAVELHYPQIQRRFRSIVGDPHAVNDLSQEVFARLCVKFREGYRIENLWAFIVGLAKKVAMEYFRKKKQRGCVLLGELQIIDACPLPDQVSEQADIDQRIRGFVKQLDADERAIITGRYVFDMTVKEIADWLDIPRSTVFDRHDQAMRKLKRLAIENGIEL